MKERELARFRSGPEPGEQAGGFAFEEFQVTCERNSGEVLARAKEVLEAVLSNCIKTPFRTIEQWHYILPTWFVAQFARERTETESREYIRWWDSLSWEQKQNELKGKEKWRLSNWIHWFRPENRAWWWWDASVRDFNVLRVTIVVKDWPFPWESLEWLFRASGALTLESEE